ncbi:hypothetical protein [Pedobacter rhizosphaerae]|uniref:Uncharacterized protein n=1 Tax=Pedobacter rhizosphaerae TaxID=390241 RepID=A0A1H9K1C3_9SPHI|nr:hypothetical protein [Pedobacter rhizosphaerae]SEQ92890.1 hypothetical protein SAMN04488023_102173 [Pedobacter rhizosphaerae]
MKASYFTIILVLILNIAKGQHVKPYLAVVKTQSDKQKGILYKVDSTHVILNDEGTFNKIAVADIKRIQIRIPKKGFKTVDFLKIGSDSQEYKMNSHGKMVDKNGHEIPTVEEELAATFFSVIGTGIANMLVWPIHKINPNQANFNLRKDRSKLNELSYYSIYYQTHPDVLMELKKMKAISASFKP